MPRSIVDAVHYPSETKDRIDTLRLDVRLEGRTPMPGQRTVTAFSGESEMFDQYAWRVSGRRIAGGLVSSRSLLTLGFVVLLAAQGFAQQQRPSPSGQSDFQIVMLSDLHFDPLHDPAKVPLLSRAPIEQWAAILSSPQSPDQPARFAAVQESCNGKESMDAPYALLHSSLAAARVNVPRATFVTVSGDLVVHDLDCRYRASLGLPPSTTDDQSLSASFAEKTTVFVMKQVEATFPRIPVYLALGNNDSRCNHNRLDAHDEYLKTSATSVIDGLRGVSSAEKTLAQSTYEAAGYYAVNMPAPMVNTRLIVIDDIYMMPKYANCEADDHDHKGEEEQAAWLQKELDSAREKDERVWVLGHLPPVANPDASLTGKVPFCPAGKAVRFQSSDDLANELTAHADIVKLGVFGHTHMDELHLLPAGNTGVPIKVVSSVSPVDGNLPAFTVGTVNPATATLADFAVYEASNGTGIATRWEKEYTFNQTYGETGFSPASLTDLIGRFRADTSGTSKDSRAYQTHLLKGAGSKKLSPSWPGYVCSLDNPTAKAFKSCVCATQ